MFKCDTPWLSVEYYERDSCWIKFDTAAAKCQGLSRKIRFFLEMPRIHKVIPRELTHDSSEAFCIWLPSTIVPLFIHWINASYIQLLSIGLFVFCKQLVCLLFHPRAYHDQTFNSTMTLYLFQRLDCFHKVPPPLPMTFLSPVSVGVKLAISFFCCLPSECGSVLLVWRKTMRTRQGFVVAEMHF